MSAPPKKPAALATLRSRKDPFESLPDELVRAALIAKGWPEAALVRAKGSPVIRLGLGLLAVVTVGDGGEDALDKVCGAHGGLPRTPELNVWGSSGETRSARVFLAPPGLAVPTAENLWGQVGGVSVLASGDLPLPPRHGDDDVWAHWLPAEHPALCKLVELPQWLADAARDPGAAARLATTVRPTRETKRELDAWETKLTRTGRRTASTFGNVMKIFRWAPPYAGRFRLNLMTQSVEFEGKAIPEGRVSTLREDIEDAPWGGFSPSDSAVMQAIRGLAEEQSYHPVQQYLGSLTWDQTPRLDAVATELLRVEDPAPLTVTMVRRWFISAVARALDPGCQVDHALVLMGSQGLKKSSFFRALAGAWFADTEIRIGDKDAYGQIHAAWITEWGEIDKITTQRHAGDVKAFVSRRSDLFRPPYGRTTANFPRSCVLVGSTNENEFLTDPTGSRRFWVVRITKVIDADAVAAVRDQLWAEAVAAYKAGELHYLLPDEELAREAAAEEFRVRDAWEEVVETWLVETWPGVSAQTQQKHLTSQTILRKAIGLEPRDMDRGVTMRLGRVMDALGYERTKERVPKAEQGLYRTIDGDKPVSTVNAWTLKGQTAAPFEEEYEPFG